MTDIRIINETTLAGIWTDWLLKPNGTLDESEELANLVKLALLTDRRASPDDILPDPDSTDLRGWWGDFEAEPIWDGWPIGCKNWLLFRAKITGPESSEGSTLVRAENYIREALLPLIDKRICTHLNVVAERSELHRINVTVTVYRGPLRDIELRFQNLWDEIREV